MNAFVRIGLSQDHHFARKTIESIRPRAACALGNTNSAPGSQDIKIKDFIKIFRHDEVSDNVIKQINNEV
jgi:hypothetical protein